MSHMKKYEESICLHKDDFLVVQTKEIEFNKPIVFVTFPSPGIIGPIIARHRILQIKCVNPSHNIHE
ncbi:MAG: hypothetical protein ACTSQC_10980 [Candidatus Heimdallarchaeaceae archaeon]